MIGGDGNPMRCCVKVPCGKHYEKYFCRNKSKQPTGLVFSAWHMYVHTFSNFAYPLRSQSLSIFYSEIPTYAHLLKISRVGFLS